jgi:ABC-2 type transport system ATP-binding protein
MIEVRDLTKAYGPHKAIDRLNFSVAKGEVVGFLGPNGAGKTTTMKIITGFMAPTSGEVKVAGFDVFEDPIEVK